MKRPSTRLFPPPSKVVNLTTNKVAKIIGKVENTERFLRIALYQGVPKKTKLRMPGPENTLPGRDPTLLCCAYGKQRLYLFTRREPAEDQDAAHGRWAMGAVGPVCGVEVRRAVLLCGFEGM